MDVNIGQLPWKGEESDVSYSYKNATVYVEGAEREGVSGYWGITLPVRSMTKVNAQAAYRHPAKVTHCGMMSLNNDTMQLMKDAGAIDYKNIKSDGEYEYLGGMPLASAVTKQFPMLEQQNEINVEPYYTEEESRARVNIIADATTLPEAEFKAWVEAKIGFEKNKCEYVGNENWDAPAGVETLYC